MRGGQAITPPMARNRRGAMTVWFTQALRMTATASPGGMNMTTGNKVLAISLRTHGMCFKIDMYAMAPRSAKSTIVSRS